VGKKKKVSSINTTTKHYYIQKMSASQFIDGKLAQLQNMIKRDPGAYVEEFQQQHRHFLSELALFQLEPSKPAGHFGEVVSFLSHVAPCYKEALKEYPTQISGLLSEHYLTLDRKLREVMVRALILMRNRNLFAPIPLLKLCFLLFRCPDKDLRSLLYKFIVADVRSMNRLSLNHRLNTDLQNFLYTMLEDASVVAARKSLDVIVELYRRRIWTGARTVNAVADVCLSKRSTLSRTACRFFLGIDHLIDADQAEEDEDDQKIVKHAKMLSERTGSVSKKTRSSKRKKAKQIKKAKKIQQKQNAEDQRLDNPRWPAIDLLHDPQGFVDKMYRKLRTTNEQFDVRMLYMNLLSRVIGRNQCICLNFYQFMTRYMQPSQRDVTKMMAYVVQGCHELIPPDELKTLILTIANNFVTDRCAGEVITVGLNGIREIVARVPLLLDEEDLEHLWLDMVEYRTHRGDKNVAVAARSALNFFREIRPEVLNRKDRGKDASISLSHGAAGTRLQYGETRVVDGVEGVELLERARREAAARGDPMEDDDDESAWTHTEKKSDDEDDDEDGWMAASDSDMEEGEGEGDGDGEGDGNDNGESEASSSSSSSSSSSAVDPNRQRLDATKILTPRDFELLEKLKKEEKQAMLGKRKRRAADFYTKDAVLQTDNLDAASVVDFVSLKGPHAMRKTDLEARLASQREGQMHRDEKAPGRKVGMSNREKEKRTKNFGMISKKRSVLAKQKTKMSRQRANQKKHREHLQKKSKQITKIRSRRKQGR
jgi:protein SDA1